MVVVAQLVRAIDCGSIGRGFKPHLPPQKIKAFGIPAAFFFHLTLEPSPELLFLFHLSLESSPELLPLGF